MKTATATVGTSLEVLAPYLPYKVEMAWVEAPKDMLGMGYHLRSLSDFEGHEVAISHRASRESFEWWSYKSVLPVLRPFSALCTPLEDGTVPAVEVAKLAFFVPDYLDQQDFDWAKAVATVDDDDEGREHLAVRISEVGYPQLVSFFYLWTNGDVHTHNGQHSNQLAIINYLRRHHFAVGLEPHQYVEKAAAPTPIQEENSPAA